MTKPYPFISSDTEIDRLNHHHNKVWLPLTGGLLPANILKYLKAQASPRVVDIATGTGIWITSLSKLLPSQADLLGLDLDVSKIPKDKVPDNVRFEQRDILSTFPQELHGTFDLVHVRLLVLALRTDEWDVAIRNAVTLLKPGGWLLWEELPQTSVRMIPPSRSIEEWWRAHMLYSDKIGRDPIAPYRLRSKFVRAGLEDCEEKVWPTWASEEVDQYDTATVLFRCVEPMLTGVVQSGGQETVQTQEDVARVEEAIRAEVGEGSQIGFDFIWAIGRAPATSRS